MSLKNKAPVEAYRRLVGMKVLAGGAKNSFPMAQAVYEVCMTDGSVRIERGRSLRCLPDSGDFTGTPAQKKEHGRSYHPELLEIINAVGGLMTPLENACWELDNPGKKQHY